MGYSNNPNSRQRILLLLPDSDVHEARLAAAVYAAHPGGDVHVLHSGAANARAELSLSLLVALLRDAGYNVSEATRAGRSWPDAARAAYRDGDVAVCLSSHMCPDSAGAGARMRPLGAFLRALRMNVIELGDGISPVPAPNVLRARGRRDVASLLLFFGISFVQLWVISSSVDPDAPITRAFLLVSATVELLCLGALFSS